MPPQNGNLSLAARMGKRLTDAHAKLAGETSTMEDGSGLPAGIENGIAQMIECRLGEYKEGAHKGQVYFMARGVVKHPLYHDGVKVFGRQTQNKMIPLCDTPERATAKTFEDHYDALLKFLRSFGVNTKTVTPAKLEETLAFLKSKKYHFTLRTWKGKKQTTGPYAGQEPRVNETWGTRCDPPPAAEAAAAVVGRRAVVLGAADEAPADEAPADDVYTDAGDLASLVDAAADDNAEGQADAQARLKELAMAAGHDEATVDAADDWQAVADLAANPPGEGEEAAAEPPTPAKTEVWTAKLKDPKNPKAAAKTVECTVVAVNEKARTADLKRNDTKAVIKGVSWDVMAPV